MFAASRRKKLDFVGVFNAWKSSKHSLYLARGVVTDLGEVSAPCVTSQRADFQAWDDVLFNVR